MMAAASVGSRLPPGVPGGRVDRALIAIDLAFKWVREPPEEHLVRSFGRARGSGPDGTRDVPRSRLIGARP